MQRAAKDNATLFIDIDRSLGGNVSQWEFRSDENKAYGICKSKYGKPINGIYFPERVEYSLNSIDFEEKETITFQAVHLNEKIDPTAFSHESLGLRWNAVVVEYTEKKLPFAFLMGKNWSKQLPILPSIFPQSLWLHPSQCHDAVRTNLLSTNQQARLMSSLT